MMSSLQIVIDENNPDENWNYVYLILTEFEISTINYDLSFLPLRSMHRTRKNEAP